MGSQRRTERGSQSLMTPCCSGYSAISPWVVPGMPVQCAGRWGAVIFEVQMPPWEMQLIHCCLSQDQGWHTGGEESTRLCFQCSFQAAQGAHRGLMSTFTLQIKSAGSNYVFSSPFLLDTLSFHSFPSVSVLRFIQSH